MRDIFDYVSTATSVKALTPDDILKSMNEALDILRKYPTPVFWFNQYIPEGMIFHGDGVNKFLNCSEFEKGYIIAEKHRFLIEKNFHGKFRERKPELPRMEPWPIKL